MQIKLPDGTVKEFETPVTGFDVAASIGEGLLRAAVAIEVNGQEQDLSEQVADNAGEHPHHTHAAMTSCAIRLRHRCL